jgi:hypothetical protein
VAPTYDPSAANWQIPDFIVLDEYEEEYTRVAGGI